VNKNINITIFEVGPRDGLQSIAAQIPTVQKIGLIDALSASGLKKIEATSFVNPKWVPQMVDAAEVMQKIERQGGVTYSALVPNLRGLENAVVGRVDEVAIFASASESFSHHNINCSIEKSFQRFQPVMEGAKLRQIPVRGYLSCAFGCPYEGAVSTKAVVAVATRLIELGCYEVVISDTIGMGTVAAVRETFKAVAAEVGSNVVAAHFHDTRGQALANILACLEEGITTFDTSIAGLGGCPYAPGAAGNVATEDVVFMAQGMGLATGIDLEKLVAAAMPILQHLNISSGSKVAQAMLTSGKVTA
jgi:hydroxymethylglutaryl-CoA lyase